MNKLEFSLLIDCFVWISETKGVVWFFVRFSFFRAFLFVFSMGKKCIYVKIKYNKRNKNATFKGEQRDKV